MPGKAWLNADKIAAAQIAFNTRFNSAFDSLKLMDPAWEMLSMDVISTTTIEQYNWLGDVPPMTEWTGTRAIGKVRNNNYQIANKEWANGLEVAEVDLEDDKLGMYMPKIDQLAMKVRQHKIDLLMDFLVNGFATTVHGAGYDGLAFFSASHKSAGGTGSNQSNILTATLDDTGAFDSAYQKFVSIQDEQGQPLNLLPTHLIYGPSNRSTANTILNAERLANGASNTNYKVVTPVLSPKLVGSHANKWFLTCLTAPIKPLIFQTRRAPRFRFTGSAAAGQADEEAFMTGKLKFGVDARYNAGFGLWETIVGSDGST